jgi:hypothetical protein
MYEKVAEIVKSDFPFLGVDYLLYSDYKEVPALLEEKQQKYDAVIFYGQVVYEYTLKRLRPGTDWRYFSSAGSTLRKALLEALLKGWDIRHLSFDSCKEAFLYEVYRELGISKNEIHVQIFTADRADEDYNRKAFEFHASNMKKPEISGCLTDLITVSKWMRESGISHILMYPCFDVIKETLSETLQFCLVKRNVKSQIIVLMLHIDYPLNFPLSLESEYHFMLEKNKVAQQVYLYAERIQASVSESSLHDYTLFSSKEIIEEETRGYRELPLLNWLEKTTVYLISAGLGQGETVSQARQNALNAVLKARTYTRCAGYVMLHDGQTIGPIFGGQSETQSSKEFPEYNARLEKAAKNTGLSVNTIYRLSAFLLERQNGLSTSKELSKGLQISKRSADRLIEKLENAGYAKEEGQISDHGHGRPSRIMKIKI